MADASEIEQQLNLTPQERLIVDYHRRNLLNPGRDDAGRPVTVYSTGIKLMRGPNAGKFVSVPGFVNGRIVNDEDELYRIWKREIDLGMWPMYESGDALNERSKAIHQIMDLEAE